MSAPTFGSGYMEVTPSPVNQPNYEETHLLSKLDPAFTTAWNSAKYLIPADWQGDPDLILATAVVAYRYKDGAGVVTPSISSINPSSSGKNNDTPLTITGTNFDADAVPVLSGVDLAAATVSPTSITTTLPAAAIKTTGTYPIQVRNANGTISNTVNFTAT